jgi:glycosyltransferase involved in cell wall biosynthesis
MVSEHASPLAVLGGVDAGGQNIHVDALSRALARAGAEVVVYSRRDNPDLARKVRMAPGVTVDHIDAGPAEPLPKDRLLPYMGAFADELAARWHTWHPDVVHAHFWMSGLASLEAAKEIGVPMVLTFHALGVVKRRHQGEADSSPVRRVEIEAELAQQADRIVATCSDEAFELLHLGADHRRVSIVPCGVDLALFHPGRPGTARGGPPFRLLSLGRLVERKGVADAIAALAEIPDAELVVAGGPPAHELAGDPEARRLQEVAAAYGVESRVRLIGRVTHAAAPALIRSSDAVICTPWYEPFGIVPVEAMACGVPVIASAVGGMIDTVVDGITGMHVPPRQPHAVASVLQDLLANPDRRRLLGAAGAARARSRFGWDRVASATAEVYQGLRSPHRAARSGRRP